MNRRKNQRKNRRTKAAALAAAALATTGVLGQSAHALNINLTLDPASLSPAFDPAATGLTNIMNEAVRQWEDIIEDTHTLDITFGWANLAAPSIGLHTFQGLDPFTLREDQALIQFDTGQSWFFDPTPSNDSEFTMGQTLSYPAVGGVIELGYSGTATSGGAVGNTDLLSVALHEIGHALGMSAAAPLTLAETADGDYDAPADLYDGTTVVIQPAVGGNIAHLAQPNSLMAPGIGTGTRKLPSAIDVMAIAAASNWSDIDLQRQDFIAGSDTFNTASHWIGNQVPGALDTAYVRDGQTAKLKQTSVTVGELIIDEDAKVEIGELAPSTLSVVGQTQVTGSGIIKIHSQGELSTDELAVGTRNGTRADDLVTLVGGHIDADEIDIEYSGVLRRYGTVEADTLKNNGKIRAYDGTLEITVSNSADLDGLNSLGVVEAGLGGSESGDLVINGAVNAFAGQMWVREGSNATFDHDWTLTDLTHLGGPRGDIFLDDGGDIRGSGTLTVNGDLVVNQPNGVTNSSITYMDIDVQSNGTLDIRGDASLVLINGGTVADGAAVIGGGNLSVPWYAGSGLTTDEDLGVHVTNGMEFHLGAGSDLTENVTVDAYTQTDTGTFFVDLGGPNPSTGESFEFLGGSHDQLVIDGEVNLDGILDVSFINGFVPELGDAFHVMVYDDAQRTGTFDDVLHPAMTFTLGGLGGIGGFQLPMYLNASYESDGLWLRTSLIDAFTANTAAIPEPASLTLLAIGSVLIRSRRPRRGES